MKHFLFIASAVLFGSATLAAAPHIAESAESVRPLLLGSKAPAVTLHRLDGSATTLGAELAGKPAVLVFYRGGWCPYCNLQLSELRKIRGDVEALGYRIIAISPDRPEELTATLEKSSLDYTLLSDSKAEAIGAFGIAFRVDDATIGKYKGFGIDLEQASGETHHALPVPSVFIVDADGTLQFSFVHPDYRVRVPGDVVVAAAKAIAEHRQQLKPSR